MTNRLETEKDEKWNEHCSASYADDASCNVENTSMCD